MAHTPYYQSIIDVDENLCTSEPDLNYTPYQMFCLSNQLQARWKGDGHPILQTEPRGDIMSMVVNLYQGDVKMDLKVDIVNKLQELVDNIITNTREHCIIFSCEGSDLPKYWCSMILPYINISEEYEPYINDNYVYIKISQTSEHPFNEIYNELTISLNKQLKELYNKGAILTNQKFASLWNLQLVKNTNKPGIGLYIPTWRDSRFAKDIVSFLFNKSAGDNTIKIKIGQNDMIRHSIGMRLSESTDFKFTGEYIVINGVNNLSEALSYTSIVVNSRLTAMDVRILPLSSKNDPILETMQSDNSLVYRKLEDPLFPYVLSLQTASPDTDL